MLNLIILGGIIRVFRSMRRGEHDEAELKRRLQSRGLMYRVFGKWMRAITKEWQMYPVGVVFGIGFDTAAEAALLAATALLETQHLPWCATMCLPVLFTAEMSMMDTADGLLMNVAYGWAFFNPVRKVYYNLAITGLSAAICFFIGARAVSSRPAAAATSTRRKSSRVLRGRRLQGQWILPRPRGHDPAARRVNAAGHCDMRQRTVANGRGEPLPLTGSESSQSKAGPETYDALHQHPQPARDVATPIQRTFFDSYG